MDSRTRGELGPVPTWLEIQGLSEESLRAAVTGLGIEILGALCARAEPASVRVQFRSLSALTFSCTMYAELCRYIESYPEWRRSQPTVGLGMDAEETEGPPGTLRIKVEDQDSVGREEEEIRDMEDGEREKPSTKLPCPLCCRRFTRKSALKMHMEIHRQVSSDKKYKCTDCSYSTHFESMFLTHVDSHPRDKRYTCGVCDKEFVDASTCQRHERTHTGERPYTCEVCTKTFSVQSELNRHARIHTGVKPHVCRVCGKGFIHSTTCQIHMRIHTGERPYTCTTCGKGFNQSSHCRIHMRTHTGERPYTCTVCDKGFRQSSHCRIHMRLHTGERPYPCNTCGKGFSRASQRRNHMCSRYACTVCTRTFSDQSDLKRPGRVHTRMKSYTCNVCGKGFTQASYFQKHVQLFHVKEKQSAPTSNPSRDNCNND